MITYFYFPFDFHGHYGLEKWNTIGHFLLSRGFIILAIVKKESADEIWTMHVSLIEKLNEKQDQKGD